HPVDGVENGINPWDNGVPEQPGLWPPHQPAWAPNHGPTGYEHHHAAPRPSRASYPVQHPASDPRGNGLLEQPGPQSHRRAMAPGYDTTGYEDYQEAPRSSRASRRVQRPDFVAGHRTDRRENDLPEQPGRWPHPQAMPPLHERTRRERYQATPGSSGRPHEVSRRTPPGPPEHVSRSPDSIPDPSRSDSSVSSEEESTKDRKGKQPMRKKAAKDRKKSGSKGNKDEVPRTKKTREETRGKKKGNASGKQKHKQPHVSEEESY
ncbi:MAG: hypothetical protein Q9183_006482, partial [Haloplaca sp. 2 TL-2023]